MKKNLSYFPLYLFISVFLSLTLSAHGQNRSEETDSLRFVGTVWKEKQIRKGILWRSAHIKELFGSTQSIQIIEADLRRVRKKIRLAALADGLKKTSSFAEEAGAEVGINGGFFDMKNGGAVDFIKVDGKIINETRTLSTRGNAVFVFSRKKVLIAPAKDSLLLYEKYPNVLLAGPLLMQKRELLPLDSNAFNKNRHPRSAVALTKDKLILITVDGRNANAQGMSLYELGQILKWYGAEEAMNLDGGGSTSLYIRGQTPNGIVNFPSDNKKFDHEGERSVANTLLIR